MIKQDDIYIKESKKDFGKKSDIFICLMFGLFPLIIKDYSDLTKTKYISFLCLTFLFLGAIFFSLGGMLLDGFKIKPKLRKSFFYSPDFFLLLYLFFNIVSFLFSPYKGLKNFAGRSSFWFGSGRYDGFFSLILYSFIFFILSNFGKLNNRHIIIVAIAVIIMCVIGIVQLCGYNVLDFYPKFNGEITDFISTIGNIDMFSGLMCLFIPLLITSYIMLENPKFTDGLLLFSGFVSVYITLELSVSSGKLAMFFVLIFLLPFLLNNANKIIKVLNAFAMICFSMALNKIIVFSYMEELEKTKIILNFDIISALFIVFGVAFAVTGIIFKFKKQTVKLNVIKVIAIIEIVVFILFFVAESFSLFTIDKGNNAITSENSLSYEISGLLRGEVNDSSGSFRIGIWKSSLDMGLDNPIFGTGVGTYLKTFQEFIKGTELSQNIDLTDTAHNEYIHLFCTVGIVGLLSYLGFLLSLAIKSLGKILKNPYIIILGSAVLCYCVQAFFSFNIVIITPLFWICAGLLYRETKEEN